MRKLLAILFNIHHPKDLKTIDDDFKLYHNLLSEQHNKFYELRRDLSAYQDVCTRWHIGNPDELDTRLRNLNDAICKYQKEMKYEN